MLKEIKVKHLLKNNTLVRKGFKMKLLNIVIASTFVCSTSLTLAEPNTKELTTRASIFSSELKGKSGDKVQASVKFENLDLDKNIFAPKSFSKLLSNVKADTPSGLRGVKEVQLYKKLSPSVVLVVSESGLGSGSVLNTSGDILTNWHVIDGAKEVGVIFKPQLEGKKISKADVRRARVVRIDEVSDLALLRVLDPIGNVTPIAFGNMQADVAVGADVHAIGHPTGESWTYTKGVVSQVRRDYKWTSESHKAHQATVIQTQTPINPGNSGGPLLTDDGKLVGVNSFKSSGEGLNFAVSVDEVQRFLGATTNRFAANVPTENAAQASANTCPSEPKEIYSGYNKDNTNFVTAYDIDCDNKADFEIRTPRDKSKAVIWAFDQNGDGRPDMLVFDSNRAGAFDFSLHDVDFDGKWDLVGFHPDGKLKASRFERYDVYIARR